MFITVKEAVLLLQMEPHQIYYLLMMGEIESIKLGKAWRLALEAVSDYVKRNPGKKLTEPACNFIYSGNGGNLFSCLSDYLPADTLGKTSGMEGRRGQLVYRSCRPDKILLSKLKPINQLELFSA